MEGAAWRRKNVPPVVWTNGTLNLSTRPPVTGASEYRSITSGFPLRARNDAWVMREYRGAVHTLRDSVELRRDVESLERTGGARGPTEATGARGASGPSGPSSCMVHMWLGKSSDPRPLRPSGARPSGAPGSRDVKSHLFVLPPQKKHGPGLKVKLN